MVTSDAACAAVVLAMNGPLSMPRLRCAILDDYLNLSLTVADW